MWWLLPIIIIVVLLRTPTAKGMIGEFIVKLVLGNSSEKQGEEKIVINNFLVKLDNGKTSQTDHILVNSRGVFVIETKNYSGRIYGDDTSKEWTQVLNYGKVKNRFYSPVKQNATHVHHIKELLPQGTPISSAVVFIKGNINYIKSAYVYTVWELYNLVRGQGYKVLSPEQIKAIGAILTENNKSGTISNAEHVQNIKQTQRDIENNICPRCGGTLVRRQSQNGAFLGCSNFPKCRFTKKL